MDRNGDGKINDGRELFGAGTVLANGQRAGNGYAARAELDTNHDGKIDAHDASFKDLKVWVDKNHDGKTDPGELKGLIERGIVELDLNFHKSDRMDHGNAVALISGYKTSYGHVHEMADVWFAPATDGGKSPPKLEDLWSGPSSDLRA